MGIKKIKKLSTVNNPQRAGTQLSTVKLSASILRAVFLVAFAYILLYPLFFMISASFKDARDFIDPTVVWVTKYFITGNFPDAFNVMEFPKSLFNTLRFEIVTALVEVLTCSVIAYGFARFEFKFKKVWMACLFLAILVPDVMLILPRIMSFKQLDILGVLGLLNKVSGVELRPNILDTALPFYLPALFGVGLKGGLFIFIYMQFFKGLPRELEDAAYIDGAGPIRTFIRIILPSAGSAFLTVTILSVVWHWGDYWQALMYTGNNRTLAYVVANIDQYTDKYLRAAFGIQNSGFNPRALAISMAACLIYIAIPLVFYLILQRKFIQSVDRVGIVG